MNDSLLTRGKSLLGYLYLLCAIVALGALLHNHWQVITFELPLDYNEAAVPTVTATIAEGGNPFSFENQPSRTSVYPVMINLLVAPFTFLFGNSMQLHRAISALLIVASTLVLFRMAHRESRSLRDSFVAGTLVYASFIYYSTPISGPNAIGLFFFFSTLCIPWVWGFSRASLIVAIGTGLLAFYSKQYFVAALGYVALYMFLAVSKQRAVLFGFACLGSFLASLAVVNALFPYYLDATVFAVAYSTGTIGSTEVMLGQMREYAMIVLPLLLVPLIGIAVRFWPGEDGHTPVTRERKSAINIRDLDAPLLGRDIQYVWHCLACSVFVFAVVIGRNPGNDLTYLFQLVSPFLLIAVATQLGKAGRLTWLYQILVVAGLYNAWAMQSHDMSVHKEENWHRLERLIANADSVYGSNIVLNEILRNDLEIVQNGHTPYFVFAGEKPDFFRHAEADKTISAIWSRHVSELHNRIRAQEFDLVILDQWATIPDTPRTDKDPVNGMALLANHYRKARRFPVSAANRPGGGIFAMQIWEPLKNQE